MTRFFAFLCRLGFHADELFVNWSDQSEYYACRRCARTLTKEKEYDPYDEIVCP